MDRLGGSKVADLHVSRLRMLYIATSARCQGMTSLVHRVREHSGIRAIYLFDEPRLWGWRQTLL